MCTEMSCMYVCMHACMDACILNKYAEYTELILNKYSINNTIKCMHACAFASIVNRIFI